MQDRCTWDKEILGEKHIQTKATESTEAPDAEDGWMPYLLAFPSGWSLLLLRGRSLLLLGGGVHDDGRRGNRGRELGLGGVIRSSWKQKCHKRLRLSQNDNLCNQWSPNSDSQISGVTRGEPSQNTELSVILSLVNACARAHTHTHTHIYIYTYNTLL